MIDEDNTFTLSGDVVLDGDSFIATGSNITLIDSETYSITDSGE